MKFLVDAQLPPALCDWLAGHGHDAVHVAEVLGGETPDRDIAVFATAAEYILITKDDDFSSRHRQPGLRVVWLRIGNSTNRALAAWLEPRWDALMAALAEDETLVEVR
jgi:predicted nuclease of predicted toxin-antitoxin system